jgi:hypothetical protein
MPTMLLAAVKKKTDEREHPETVQKLIKILDRFHVKNIKDRRPMLPRNVVASANSD